MLTAVIVNLAVLRLLADAKIVLVAQTTKKNN